MFGEERSNLWKLTDCGDRRRYSRAWAANQVEIGEDLWGTKRQRRLRGTHLNGLGLVAPNEPSGSGGPRDPGCSSVGGVGLHLEFHAGDQRFGAAAVTTAIGIGVMAAAIGLFRRTGQNPKPWESTPEIISTGVYRFTRNPMYVSMALLQTGIGLALASAPPYKPSVTRRLEVAYSELGPLLWEFFIGISRHPRPTRHQDRSTTC